MTDKQKLREEIIETTKKVRDTGLIYGKEGFDYLLEVLEEYTDYNDGYNAGVKNGMETAWEFVQKLCDMNCKETKNIFCVSEGLYDVTRNFTPQEALAKLKAYEEQSKIEVGDVVEMPNGNKCVVTVVRDGFAGGVSENGWGFYDISLCDLKKTDKHIDIKSILESIGE